jgi:hypothetical protein
MQMMESKMTKMLLLLCTTAAVAAGGDLESRSNATDGGDKFIRCYQKLFNCSKGGMHVRHAPLSCGHQMGLC